MIKAVWNGEVIAESDEAVVVDGNHYFPPESVNREPLDDSSTQTRCLWKGEASYFGVVADGQVNRDAASTYPDPKPAAAQIKDHGPFRRGVRIESRDERSD